MHSHTQVSVCVCDINNLVEFEKKIVCVGVHMVSKKIGKFGEVSIRDALMKAWKVLEKQHFWTWKMVMVLKSLGILYRSI